VFNKSDYLFLSCHDVSQKLEATILNGRQVDLHYESR
jgi:hypothetical protein